MNTRAPALCVALIGVLGMSAALANPQLESQALAGINVPKLIQVTSKDGLQPKALKAALNAYAWAVEHHKLGANKNTLTVVDFTLPSYEKRMWVIDLKSDKVLMKIYTTQGKGSGLVYAKRFSNRIDTDESSLGLYVTSNEYYGHHGKAMRLNGLEKGINGLARRRAVVIHSAWYATPSFIEKNHRAGRSWGCFAIAPDIKNKLLNDVQGGSALFAYALAENHDPIVEHGPLTDA